MRQQVGQSRPAAPVRSVLSWSIYPSPRTYVRGGRMPDDPARAPALTELAACRTRGDFGRLLTRLRRSAGRSIREVSAATRIPVATLGDYFNGKHLPPARDRTLQRILEACGVTGEETVAAWLAALERVRVPPGRGPARALPGPGLLPYRRRRLVLRPGRTVGPAGRTGRADANPGSAAGGDRPVGGGQVVAAAGGPDSPARPGYPGHRVHPRTAAGAGPGRRGRRPRGAGGRPGASHHRGPVRRGLRARSAGGRAGRADRDAVRRGPARALRRHPGRARAAGRPLRPGPGRPPAGPVAAGRPGRGGADDGRGDSGGHCRAGPQGPPRPGAWPGRPDAARTAAGTGPPWRPRPRRAAAAVARPAGHLG